MVNSRMIKDAILKKKKELAQKVKSLLQKQYEPAVAIQPSKIRNADFGLFTTRPVQKGEALCLYPGVFSAGLPNGVMVPAFGEANLYFMGLLFPPSGVHFEEQNCYTLDVTPNFGVIEKVSGYIDALALSVNVVSPYYQSEDDIYGSSLIDETVQHEIDANSSGSGSSISSTSSGDENNKRSNSRIEQRRLDENPAACGHFMNHSPTPNSTVYTFAWEDVYPKYRPGTWNDTSKATYDLPNIARTDGAPRYIMYVGSEMIFYPVDEMRFQVKDVCGAVICANHDMETGQEVLRDYELQQPYPQWAIDWYVASPDIDGFPSSDSNTDTAIENNEKEDDGEEWRLT